MSWTRRLLGGAFAGLVALAGCSDADHAGNLPTWSDEPCATVSELSGYEEIMARWRQQTDAAPFEAGRIVFTGSSSIRYWEPLQEDLSPWSPIQRGFGGSTLWDLAEYLPETVLRHEPSAVVIFSGTNDIAEADRAPEVVADAYRCVVERIASALGDDVSIHYIAITPTPSRWEVWPNADAANRLIEEIASRWRGLHFIDTTPAFLATGRPPDASLFLSDELHLSDAGYAMWREAVFPHLEATVARVSYSPSSLASGTRVRVDLGPSSVQDGAPVANPDASGAHWNSWSAVDAEVLLGSGEHLGRLIDTNGNPTDLRLVFSSASHFTRGIRHGGLVDPASDLLGTLAVPEATQDYLFAAVTGTVIVGRGSLTIEGLDPAASYALRLFASRADAAPASTRYTVTGGTPAASAVLATSGVGTGHDGTFDGNDSEIVEFRDLAADPSGRLHIDFEPVDASLGSVAYLSLLELEVQ